MAIVPVDDDLEERFKKQPQYQRAIMSSDPPGKVPKYIGLKVTGPDGSVEFEGVARVLQRRGRKKNYRKISQKDFNRKLPNLLSKYASPKCAWDPTRENIAAEFEISPSTLDTRFKGSPYKSIRDFKATVSSMRAANRPARITK